MKIKVIKGGKKLYNETFYNPMVTNNSHKNSVNKSTISYSLKNHEMKHTASLKNFDSPSRLRKGNNINKYESVIERIANSPSPVIKRNRINLNSPDFKKDFKSIINLSKL